MLKVLNDERRRKLVELCSEMIRTPSLSGQEGDVARLLKKTMEECGYDDISIDEMGNVVGRIKFSRPGKKILFEGHMDHVEEGDPGRWSHDPHSADIVDGRLYGRATSDMKGALSAMVIAGALLKEDLGDKLSGEFVVGGCVHEECFEGVASRLIGEAVKPDCVVIGEASELKIKRGQRGRAEVVLETMGKNAHSSNPEAGVNAVRKMTALLAEVERQFKPVEDAVLGKGILEPTDIVSAPYPGASVVPHSCRVTFDRRLLVGETREFVLGQIQEIIDRMKADDPELEASVSFAVGEEKCYTGAPIRAERFAPAWLFPEDHELVQAAARGIKEVGIEPEFSHYYFCTNGSYYAGIAGIPTIGFGPSLERLAHVIDEYIELDQLEKVCEGYYGIARSLLG